MAQVTAEADRNAKRCDSDAQLRRVASPCRAQVCTSHLVLRGKYQSATVCVYGSPYDEEGGGGSDEARRTPICYECTVVYASRALPCVVYSMHSGALCTRVRPLGRPPYASSV